MVEIGCLKLFNEDYKASVGVTCILPMFEKDEDLCAFSHLSIRTGGVILSLTTFASRECPYSRMVSVQNKAILRLHYLFLELLFYGITSNS